MDRLPGAHGHTAVQPSERFYGAASGVPQMAHRGRIRSGADADFIVFGPNTVTGHSTMEKAGLPSSGISSVAVNGTVVVKKSMVLKDVTPGTPVRFWSSPRTPRWFPPRSGRKTANTTGVVEERDE